MTNYNKSGIYWIRNFTTGKYYVGSAVNISIRFTSHRSRLNRNVHGNPYLQSAWNKYGEKTFEFKILECCEKEKLIEREQYWIDQTRCYEKEIGYNVRKVAESNFGIEWSIETKNRMAKSQTGRKHSIETRAKMSVSQTGRIVTDKMKLIQSITHKGNTYRLGKTSSEESKIKNRLSHLGKKASEETKAKMSIARQKYLEKKQNGTQENINT